MPMGMVKIQSSPSKQERQPLVSAQFNVWKRTIPAQLLQPLEEDAETQRFKEVEWMSDLFDATLLTDKVSLSQLRNCHLTSKQTQILATLVPDEVIHIKDLEKKETSTFVGVLLFADVSGFTALCEKYNNTGKGGTYQLTATLNGYIGAMVEVIYSHGGDVLKFSGDAFLAIWKVKRDDFMFHVIHEALSCALYIQQTLGSYETDVKVFLKVKLAISAGNMTFSVIGDDKSRHYICVGSPINDVKMAEHTCMSGDVVLSPSAWGHCSSSNYEYTYKDSQHVKITRIIYNPGISKRQVVQQFQNVSVLIDTKKKNGPAEQEIQDTETPVEVSESGTEVEGEPSPTSMVRPCVKEASRRRLGLVLRPFMIPPVVQQVDADQPLEFLTEMRQVTTMFVNLIPSKVPTNVLIQMVDDAYMIICRLVRTAMGCVNKVSLFDKDVMFLVIFGLRGYKHESEGQSGLKCAYSVRRAVSELQGVACGSVGVTTGMVYCGVVGHPLRREYTVIGAPVNKAARIMCAYPGKVTCDQNTFLHSKLPASSFILQEAKELKGIGTVGAIYEYTEEKRKESAGKATVGMFPILGREEPINIFESLLEKVEEPVRQYSGMLIQGDARVGKSRLLDELVAKAHQWGTTPILVALSNIHMNVPYSAVRQIFNQVLGLSESATSRDIEERLVSVLGAHVSPDELCYLNDVLQVKFPHSAQYLSETPEVRKLNTHKIFRDLIHLSCNKLVVAVDDAQYIDQKSWELLFDVLDEDSTLIVMTMYNGHRHNQAEAARDLLNHSKVLKFQLSGLDENHLAPLACQILNVKAIAPELEIILQNRSGGNPGWCESFLLSLLQSGGLKIQHLPESEVQCRAFIQPDLWLTEKRLLLKSSGRDMVGKPQSSEEQPHTSMLPTCAVASNYDMSEKGVPQNLDAMIMTAFDSLTPYEQLLLKCASVLGNTFTRTMLDAVMHNPIPRQTAHAVKRLFEMRVLNCGTEESGSASHQPNYVVHRVRNSILTDHGHTIRCYCQVKSVTLDDGEEMPKYAFCRLLHFKIPLFRETTYELLPGNQKKEFHARAVNFLESEAHKCAACGGGDFVYIGHVPLEAELQSKQSGKNVQRELKAESVIAPRKSAMSTRTACKKEEISESKCINGLMVEKIEAEEGQKTRIFPKKGGLIGAVCRNKVQDVKSGSYISIGRTHPAVDFRNCECPLILASVYHQLIDHCTAAGLKEKQIRFLIESGAAAITIGNNTQAISLLTQAMELSIAKAESDENEFNLTHATKKFNLGKIHALLGQANLDLGQLGEARQHLQTAMCHFGRPFITWPVVRNINLQWQLYKQWLHHKFPRVFMRRARCKKATLYNEIAAALSHLSNLYMVEQEWTLAKLAAIESLNFAQKSSSNLYELCAAYSNMMDVCHHYGKLMYCKRLEKTALQTCKALYVGEEAKELLALGRLYCASFSSRLLRGELISSIKIGFRTLQISGRVYANNVKLFVLPMLIQALVMNMRLDEAVDLLRELLFTAVEDLDKSSVAWYHALCLDIVLDTCFTVEKATDGYEFGANLLRDKQQGTGLVVRDPDSVRRLVISMWNWCIRNREWNEAKKWSDIAMKYRDVRPDDSFSNLISALKYLECLLLTITTNLDTPRPSDVSHLRADARSLIKKLNKVAQTSKIILPRFLHLKAYFNCIREYRTRAAKLLAEASQWSEQQQNHLESAWIKHSKMVWTSTINSIDLDFWKEHSNDENYIDWHEYTLHNLSQVTYSLRIPKASI